MHRYQFPTPRIAFGFAAVAMTALTLGTLVVLPSRMESDSQTYGLLAASPRTLTSCGAADAKPTPADRAGGDASGRLEKHASCAIQPVPNTGQKSG
jgi:hypothetical protein